VPHRTGVKRLFVAVLARNFQVPKQQKVKRTDKKFKKLKAFTRQSIIQCNRKLISCSKSATPKQILGVQLSQLLRQWRSWRTGSAAYAWTACVRIGYKITA